MRSSNLLSADRWLTGDLRSRGAIGNDIALLDNAEGWRAITDLRERIALVWICIPNAISNYRPGTIVTEVCCCKEAVSAGHFGGESCERQHCNKSHLRERHHLNGSEAQVENLSLLIFRVKVYLQI